MALTQRSPMQSLAILHLSVLLFGFAGLFGKWIAWDPAAIVLGRTSVAALVLALVVRLRDGGMPKFSWAVAPNGVILALHWVAFFTAIQVSTVAIGLLGYASFPLFVPLLERVLLGVPMRRREFATAVLVVLGLAMLVPEFSWASRIVHGLAWGVLSGFTFALLTVRTRQLTPAHRAPEIALWQNLVAVLCIAPVVLWQGGPGGPVTPQALVLVVLLGTLCTALAHALFIASLARLTASTVAVVAALEPVYGIALALMLLHEVPDLRTLLGAALLLVAAVIVSRRTFTLPPA